MRSEFDEIMTAIAPYDSEGNQGLANLYERSLEQSVLEFGRTVVGFPSADAIRKWLTLYARLSTLAVEGLAEITLQLRESQPDAFQAALDALTSADRKKIETFIKEISDQDTISPAEIAANDRSVTSHLNVLEGARIESLNGAPPVLAKFIKTGVTNGPRVTVITGILTVLARDNSVIGQYQARTGGFVNGYWNHDGPTPPGAYVVSHYRSNRAGTLAMELNGVSFSFDLDHTAETKVFGRSGFRIHPDGPPPGTHGCIGVFGDAGTLRRVADDLSGLLEVDRAGRHTESPFLLTVRYSSSVEIG